MKHEFTNIGRLFYFNAEIPADVAEITLEVNGMKATARKLVWRFFWLTDIKK